MNPQHALALVLSCIAAPAVAGDDSLQALAITQD